MAVRLAEIGEYDYEFICTPTGYEMPGMLAHWEYLETILGQEIIKLTDPKFPDLISLIDHFNALPNWRQRWCTRVLKIEVMIDYYLENEGSVAYVGLRDDEPAREGGIYGDYVEQAYPLRYWGWGLREVLDYLNEKSITIPARTDCSCCFYQGTAEWWNLWKDYHDLFMFWENKEIEVGHTFRSESREKKWPGNLTSLRECFESGQVPRNANVNYELFAGQYNKCRACTI